jgi:hypothetical protein
MHMVMGLATVNETTATSRISSKAVVTIVVVCPLPKQRMGNAYAI